MAPLPWDVFTLFFLPSSGCAIDLFFLFFSPLLGHHDQKRRVSECVHRGTVSPFHSGCVCKNSGGCLSLPNHRHARFPPRHTHLCPRPRSTHALPPHLLPILHNKTHKHRALSHNARSYRLDRHPLSFLHASALNAARSSQKGRSP